PLFPGFSLAVLRGVSSLSVGQWWRIIGTFIILAIVILKKILNRLFILQRKPNWCFVRLTNEKRGGFSTSFYFWYTFLYHLMKISHESCLYKDDYL
ncbi:hypothetical protein, partial [Xenorhabdus bovienii]|uniref:hypothetical protein n=1 Tax=Xenorhabdus bovienii TaxID=40576 RepID=UPI0023B2809B